MDYLINLQDIKDAITDLKTRRKKRIKKQSGKKYNIYYLKHNKDE